VSRDATVPALSQELGVWSAGGLILIESRSGVLKVILLIILSEFGELLG